MRVNPPYCTSYHDHWPGAFAEVPKIAPWQSPTGRNHPLPEWPTFQPAHLSACFHLSIKAEMEFALMANAVLQGACLAEADMSGTQLDAATLTGADLRKANLREAGFRDARLDEPTSVMHRWGGSDVG
jgi:Pentapeptide repeats (8 copies)